MKIITTTDHVISWAEDRQILAHAKPEQQWLKVTEERGEVAACLAKDKPIDELQLELGDLVVTLIITAKLKGLHLDDCLKSAYEKIKDRKGRLTESGIFVKDGD